MSGDISYGPSAPWTAKRHSPFSGEPILSRHRADGGRRVGARAGELAARATLRNHSPRICRALVGRALDQRRADGGLLPARRPGDQTRDARRPAFDLAAARPAGNRRGWRHAGSRPGVSRPQPRSDRSGLGDTGGHRHRLRARCDRIARQPCSRIAESVPGGIGDPGRPRRGLDHRGVLYGEAIDTGPGRGSGRDHGPGEFQPPRRPSPDALSAGGRDPVGAGIPFGHPRDAGRGRPCLYHPDAVHPRPSGRGLG